MNIPDTIYQPYLETLTQRVEQARRKNIRVLSPTFVLRVINLL